MKKGVYRIGVLADTHNQLPAKIHTLFQEVDEIWHLGDVCREEILDELRGLNSRLSVVLGNNDLHLQYPLTLDLERFGERFHLVHIPPRRWPTRATCDWLLYGHTHLVLNELREGVHHYNPGSAGKANKGELSAGLLQRAEGGTFQVETLPL